MKQINEPKFASASVLTAIELNNLHFADKHTRLTPELLKGVRAQTAGSQLNVVAGTGAVKKEGSV